jgi:hypothetical protein
MKKFTEITLNYNGENITYPLNNNIKCTDFENSLYFILGIEKNKYQIVIYHKNHMLNLRENKEKLVQELIGLLDKNVGFTVKLVNKLSENITQMCEEMNKFKELLSSSIFSNLCKIQEKFKEKIKEKKQEFYEKFNDLENSINSYFISSLDKTHFEVLITKINKFDSNVKKLKKEDKNEEIYEEIQKIYSEIEAEKSKLEIEDNFTKLNFTLLLQTFNKIFLFILKDFFDVKNWDFMSKSTLENKQFLEDFLKTFRNISIDDKKYNSNPSLTVNSNQVSINENFSSEIPKFKQQLDFNLNQSNCQNNQNANFQTEQNTESFTFIKDNLGNKPNFINFNTVSVSHPNNQNFSMQSNLPKYNVNLKQQSELDFPIAMDNSFPKASTTPKDNSSNNLPDHLNNKKAFLQLTQDFQNSIFHNSQPINYNSTNNPFPLTCKRFPNPSFTNSFSSNEKPKTLKSLNDANILIQTFQTNNGVYNPRLSSNFQTTNPFYNDYSIPKNVSTSPSISFPSNNFSFQNSLPDNSKMHNNTNHMNMEHSKKYFFGSQPLKSDIYFNIQKDLNLQNQQSLGNNLIQDKVNKGIIEYNLNIESQKKDKED